MDLLIKIIKLNNSGVNPKMRTMELGKDILE